ncbi:hypothetical protein COO03_04990 [Bacillus sp. AFS098217]|uniref:helix-turn-helix domain-containing protein n=1 Tax=Bacillus sp. AFS098217 TaxID=2033868 RepID=UPI000BEE077A|nr:helix-turn-helix transcriptional regulator [Bacillus sp. AFS098217]PEB54598.1 hypothetical protein COO03_04990 [Bacillus sp. AFS098217]
MEFDRKSLDKKEVGKRIIQIMGRKNLTYEGLGKRLVNKEGNPVPKGTVYSWKRGLALPSLDIVKQLALLGDTTVEWIYQGKSLPELPEKMRKQIGKRINGIRIVGGWTLEEFGKLVGYASNEMVISWENGVHIPDVRRIEIISLLSKRKAERSVTWLLYGDIEEPFKEYAQKIFSKFDSKLHAINEDFYMELWKMVSMNQISYENESEILKAALKIRPSLLRDLLNDKRLELTIKN